REHSASKERTIQPSDGSRRLPHHQMRRNSVVGIGSVFFPDKRLQGCKSRDGKLGAGQDYGGQRWLGQMRERNIVKTDQRYIVGDLQPCIVNRAQGSNRG